MRKKMRRKGVGARVMSDVLRDIPRDGMLLIHLPHQKLKHFYEKCAKCSGFRVVVRNGNTIGLMR